jgi:hypothetical protein
MSKLDVFRIRFSLYKSYLDAWIELHDEICRKRICSDRSKKHVCRKNRSKNVNLCFLILTQNDGERKRERIGFDSTNTVCAFYFVFQYMIIMRCSHIHLNTYLGGLIK